MQTVSKTQNIDCSIYDTRFNGTCNNYNSYSSKNIINTCSLENKHDYNNPP